MVWQLRPHTDGYRTHGSTDGGGTGNAALPCDRVTAHMRSYIFLWEMHMSDAEDRETTSMATPLNSATAQPRGMAIPPPQGLG